MYFNFEDYRPDTPTLPRSLTRLEASLLTVVIYLAFVIVLLIWPNLPFVKAWEAERLQHELNVTLPAEIRKAVEHGDLRENSEYKAALERQQFVQARLGQLRQRLSKLSSIDISQIPADKVGLGSEVTVEDENGSREKYNLVFGDSVEFEDGHVSMSSPIGLALVGKGVGDTTILKLPAMVRRLKIISLKTIHQD